MRRLSCLLALMVVLLTCSTAFAQVVYTEVETFKWNGSQWVSQGTGGLSVDARCWKSGSSGGFCNQPSWQINVTNHASVAQWLWYNLSGTRWDWRIRKPGSYAADCIEFQIRSNAAVKIDYQDFGDLAYIGDTVGKQTIDTYYAYGADIGQAASRWVRAADLNTSDDLIPDSMGLHGTGNTGGPSDQGGLSYKLWNRIDVVNCNSACEYEDTAIITLELQVIKPWIDTTTPGNLGGFIEPQPWD